MNAGGCEYVAEVKKHRPEEAVIRAREGGEYWTGKDPTIWEYVVDVMVVMDVKVVMDDMDFIDYIDFMDLMDFIDFMAVMEGMDAVDVMAFMYFY